MSEIHERLFTYGARAVSSYEPETWTDEVKALFERLERRDYSAVAPLLSWDIEFLCNQTVIAALINLKYAPELPDKMCRAELRKIANVVRRRPGRPRRKLPYGDFLEAELKGLTTVIERAALLEVKSDAREIQARVEVALRNPMLDRPKGERGMLVSGLSEGELKNLVDKWLTTPGEPDFPPRWEIPNDRRREMATIAFSLYEAMDKALGRIRKPRSWALRAMADHYRVEPKEIEQAISRDLKAGRRRR